MTNRDAVLDKLAWDRTNGWFVAGIATLAVVVVLASAVTFDIAVPERGIGIFRLVSARTSATLLIAGLVTQFGDPWFLLLVATFVYLLGTQRSLVKTPRAGAFVLAVTFAAFSLIDLLKNFFIAPRPPGAGTVTVPTWLPAALAGSFQSITTGTGYAFPSGHALGTTAVFAALAYRLEVGPRTGRWAAAAVGVALVTASRIFLGVHFFVDIAVGVLAGLGLFAIAASVGGRAPIRVFALGSALGVLAVVASAASPAGELWKAGQWLGASLGAGVAWYAVGPSYLLSLRETAAAGIPIAALWVGIYTLEPPLVVTVVGTAVAAGVTIAAPSFAEQLVEES
ncbi:phosphoesterase PA-phosphatase related protein [Halogeometricum pallidum JCM 14848]|uniref:Phosphoesterase PA-phosphatase related protein n=1 Tax=Halogeometricum pallidum JCM 14848 TaxID=1227487 RepID=M0DBH7_HALPD|nr:phosphatase PAP2 family protein [Halogeometricum pallidum]ELZ32850.1 phosphoesterase PA-phosphatase related protein [Halogeometricum pallidum JCM 14848]